MPPANKLQRIASCNFSGSVWVGRYEIFKAFVNKAGAIGRKKF
ncbi:MAG: hypothetical protein WKF71_10340 [Pyrinomonadaceae bacterium]